MQFLLTWIIDDDMRDAGQIFLRELWLDSKIRLKLSRRLRKRFQDHVDELASGR